MVGRGPLQLMYPSQHGTGGTPSYSNQSPNKMESFDIPNIKQEQTPFVVTTDLSSSGSGKSYPQPPFVVNPYHQMVPQETAIFLLPIEQLSNNPYKQQDDSNQSFLFQKFPPTAAAVPSDEHNWSTIPSSSSSGDGSNVLPFFPPYKDQKSLEKEDEFLAQLLDVGGFLEELGNDTNIPSNDLFIPVANSDSPKQQDEFTSFSPQTSPMQLMPSFVPQYGGSPPALYEGGVSNSPPGLKGEEYDPLVSGVNEIISSPRNEIVTPSNEPAVQLPVVNDDLQDILGELFGDDDFSFNNSFGHTSYTPHDINVIPSSTQFPVAPPTHDEGDETNQKPSHVPEDNIIPSFDLLPPLPPVSQMMKVLPRGSSSSTSSMGDISRAMETSDEEEPRQKPLLASPHGPSPLDELHSSPLAPSKSENTTSSGSAASMLFGQHEEGIIRKLLSPQGMKSSKPITRDKLVVMPVEEFNAMLDEANLTEIEVAFMKEWRRRGKNKMAAQIARKRKREELFELEDDMGSLREKRAKLQQSVADLQVLISSFKRRAHEAEKRIYRHYSAARGSLVSEETHTIHVTDDGKTMLIPRMSTEVLLV